MRTEPSQAQAAPTSSVIATAATPKGTGLRLGGARADFVAGLGRKAADLRACSAKVRDNPDDIPRREELRRKMHALSSAAKLMKFDAMDRALADALGTIDRTDLDAGLAIGDLDSIDHVLEDLPALAWGDADARASRVAPAAEPSPMFNALVVGSALIAEALLDEPPPAPGSPAKGDAANPRLTFSCESTPDAQTAFDLARSTEPDLIVLDADLEGATDLVDSLMDDPLTEGAPIVVVGSFLEPGEAARYVAMGVAKTLAKPTSKIEMRGACEDALQARHRALPGDGRNVQDASALSFPPHVDLAYGDRSRTRLRGPAAEVRLEGRTVVVADDDPAVVWFLADLLTASGCLVHEAFDGEQALELAYRTSPDLLVCDIMMPKLDGFSLCRKLRRDVALHDVPILLLSWKEDLLQRVRELGAGADGYVRKESDTRAIVARIREALRPRAHIELRLRAPGEVRGRLDGISVRTLLAMVCATRPAARISVRDASFNYEIEVRDGAPRRASRTAGDGGSLKGEKVLAAMLGVSAGRFTVTTSTSALEGDLTGDLASQLTKPVARARAATTILNGASATKVGRIALDANGIEDYLRAMPEVVRTVTRRLQGGTPPRALVLEGASEAGLVEDLICDLAARGVVSGIVDERDADLLGPETARLLARAAASVTPAPRPALAAAAAAVAAEAAAAAVVQETRAKASIACAGDASAPLCKSPKPGGVGSDPDDDGASSLEDALLRVLATRSPSPAKFGRAHGMTARLGPTAPGACSATPSPRASNEDGTPSPDTSLALADPTVIDDTCYAERDPDDGRDPSIPIQEGSPSLPLSAPRASHTPFPAVTMQHIATLAATQKAWPMAAFVVTTGIVAWAIMHFSASGPVAKSGEGAPPPQETRLTAERPESVTYTFVAAGAAVPAGQGILEIVGPSDAIILVDGTERGRGSVTLVAVAGSHDVRIGGAPSDPPTVVDVRSGRIAHVKF